MSEKNTNNRSNTRKLGSQSDSRLQLRHKIALSFSLLFIVATTACWLLFQNELNRSLREYSNVLGSSLAEQTADSVRELVLVKDLLGLNVLLTQLVRDNTIAHASVFDVDDNLLSRAGLSVRNEDSSAPVYQANITLQEAIAGTVQLGLDLTAINSYQARLRNLFLTILGISLVLVVATAYALAGRITGPLQLLLSAINGRRDGSDTDNNNADVDEILSLQRTIDNLLEDYDQMQERLLETGVWDDGEQEDDDGPARIAASILIIKVVNINTAIEMLHPATLASLLQEYLFYLHQAARLYGGVFHHQNGDSVMLCFSAENCGDRHSINALQCAGLFQSLMNTVNTRHRESSGQLLDFRLAIHTGDVFQARELAQGNSDNVLGKTIEITYFLCNQGLPNQLVISESACYQARQFEDFDTAGQNDISMPADNVSFMAYILDNNFGKNMELIRKQHNHILGSTSDNNKENAEK